jgi:hypothetical protein
LANTTPSAHPPSAADLSKLAKLVARDDHSRGYFEAIADQVVSSRSNTFRGASRPPESGGQRDRDAVEIAREEVPKPHSDKVWFGNLPSRDPSGRAALLTQEGVALPKGFDNLDHHLKLLLTHNFGRQISYP